MVSLNIAVSDSDREFIEKQVTVGGFRDSAEYIVSLIEADRARQIRQDLESRILEGLQSPRSPMPDEEWDEIRRLGDQILAEKQKR
jgi:Arc/MetJ-type ribon-helix-helix transcriptional regulator